MKEEKKEKIKKIEQEETRQTVEETAPETPEAGQDVQEEEQKELTVEEQLEAANAEIASLKDQLLRKIAEFDNYRKRTIKEKTDLILNGGEKTIVTILPVLDDMERALQNTQDEAAREGLQLIFNKLMTTLQQKGLKPIECKGEKFDENIHDAVMQMPAADETQKNIIMDVVEKGYYLNDKVLRHPKVVVAI